MQPMTPVETLFILLGFLAVMIGLVLAADRLMTWMIGRPYDPDEDEHTDL